MTSEFVLERCFGESDDVTVSRKKEEISTELILIWRIIELLPPPHGQASRSDYLSSPV